MRSPLRRHVVQVLILAIVVMLLTRIAWSWLVLHPEAPPGELPLFRQLVRWHWFQFALDLVLLSAVGFILRRLLLREWKRRRAQSRHHHLTEIAVLSGGFAHEVRNHLGAMQTHFALLRRSLTAAEPSVQDRVAKLEEVTESLEQLLANFLNFTRPNQGQLQAVDLAPVLRQVIDFEALELERAKIHVLLDLPPDLPQVWVDPGRFRPALLNLIVNARQAMPSGGELSLAASYRHRHVHLTIQDSGVGIRPEDLPRIFDAYFTTKPEGTGLGLAIVKRTIEDLGGTITVQSPRQGGTRFTLVLPAAINPSTRPPAAARTRPAAQAIPSSSEDDRTPAVG